MSHDYYFYLERLQPTGWDSPEELIRVPQGPECPVRPFTWLKGSSPVRELFVGERALLRFQPGYPPDISASRLFRHYHYLQADDLTRLQLAWIPLADLMLDLWEEPGLTLAGQVCARDADLFGDGQSPFPASALQARGWSEAELARLRAGRLTTQPHDRTTGPGRYTLANALPTSPLPVTWIDSISGYLHTERAQAFYALRRYGTEAELRVIMLYA